MIFSKKEQSIEIKLDLFELSLYRFVIDEIIHWTKSSIQIIIHDIHFLFTFRAALISLTRRDEQEEIIHSRKN